MSDPKEMVDMQGRITWFCVRRTRSSWMLSSDRPRENNRIGEKYKYELKKSLENLIYLYMDLEEVRKKDAMRAPLRSTKLTSS